MHGVFLDKTNTTGDDVDFVCEITSLRVIKALLLQRPLLKPVFEKVSASTQ